MSIPDTPRDLAHWRASLADCRAALRRLHAQHRAGRLGDDDLALRTRLLREVVGGLRRGIRAAEARMNRTEAA